MNSSLGKFVGALFLILLALILVNDKATTTKAGVNHHEPNEMMMLSDDGLYNNDLQSEFDNTQTKFKGAGAKGSTNSMYKELKGFNPKVH
ncbi:MAG: hypothetical protein I3J02_00545 [Prevotella sp.]|nr:hypothetical protein [Prevotella sp.]